ncbi:MAG: lamin tail domain-containing protein, partial [Chthoniobacteraceae bacterium]
MTTISVILSVAALFTFAAPMPASAKSVVINEIHYNPTNNTVRSEFIELYNASPDPVNLTGWRLSGAIDFSFPANTTLAPGAYLLVAQDPATVQTRFGKSSLGPWTGGLSSDGETIRLRDSSDEVVSRVDYGSGFPWPVAPNGDGTTMELVNPNLEEDLGANWRAAILPPESATTDTGSPGEQNLQFVTNAPPAIRQVIHTPQVPKDVDPIVISAKITDPDGVAQVSLSYQIVAPGSYLPAFLPNPVAGNNIATETRQPDPAFENAANWTTVAMHDDGLAGDLVAGDDVYSVQLPAQANRTLVRYRITMEDTLGASARAPFADDGSLNFACYVYDGVPDYQNIPASDLTKLPVYQVITRPQDWAQCLAYSSSFQINQGNQARFYFNWECAFFYDGVVYDHTDYRLRGANGRYQAQSKRSMRFRFHKGSYLAARDQDGNLYPRKWAKLTTGKGFDNRATLTYGLNEAINYYLWNTMGVPSPNSHWVHLRVVQTATEQQDRWRGDFQGLLFIQEDYDVRFLEAHNLAKGNLYKLLNQTKAALEQQRYQAPFAPTNGSDHNWVENSLSGSTPPATVAAGVNLDKWYRYHALAQAIRHYDYWPDANKNMTWYFEPDYEAANQNRGKLWILPFDTDASWGPTWNEGHDVVYNALFSSGASGGDGGTNPTLWPGYFNAVREVRDLVFQPDQITPLIDQFAAVIAPMEQADSLRWKSGPSSAGNYNGIAGAGIVSLDNLKQDMLNFAFSGGTWPGGNVGAGGRAAFLDSLQASLGEGTKIPNTPTISYVGPAGFPNNGLTFSATPFADPQGAESFAAMQWRMAEVTDPNSPAYVEGEKLKLEWTASYDSGEIPTLASQFRFPAAASRPGHTYRARVRYQDDTGRWSHWSAPVQFTASGSDISVLTSSLVVSEVMYRPAPPTPAETAQGWLEDDFEYLEIRNVGDEPVDMTDVRFTKGVEFDFE